VIESEKDIIGKINAILEKRDMEALMEKPVSNDDFPMLTEVVDAELHALQVGVVKGFHRHIYDQRLTAERRMGERRVAQVEPESSDSAFRHEFECSISALEQKLSDMLIREQLRTEERLTKLIIDLLSDRSELRR
jgi:hypothetical protein